MAKGVTHVNAGIGGAGFTNNFPRNPDGSYNLPPWVTFAKQFQNGYVRVTASGDKLLVEVVSDDDGSVFDSFTLQVDDYAVDNSGDNGGNNGGDNSDDDGDDNGGDNGGDNGSHHGNGKN